VSGKGGVSQPTELSGDSTPLSLHWHQGVPHQPQTIVTERFTRSDSKRLHYHFTISDPKFYAQPWTGENEFGLSNDRMYESACHEGNYALGHVLRGARAQEAMTQWQISEELIGGSNRPNPP